MKKVGVTGQFGFIGTHLFNTLGLFPEKFCRIEFDRSFFSDPTTLDSFVAKCDVIVHLAGVNRNIGPDELYEANLSMAKKLIDSMNRLRVTPQIIFSSSIQEELNNHYGNSKKDARIAFEDWAITNSGKFVGLIIPNVYGPFSKPYYNSVVATFCHQLNHGYKPIVEVNSTLNLIYIDELISLIIEFIDNESSNPAVTIRDTSRISVKDLLHTLVEYRDLYINKGIIPLLNSVFEINLFNTFRSFEDIARKFPVKYKQYKDQRGSFTELIQLQIGGQVSFSITYAGKIRGNHFHTRKIERFSVIAGEATIHLRKIGTEEIITFNLSGSEPSYVDIPIWYTHSITNSGKDDLYTVFWINEFFNPSAPDTYLESVIIPNKIK